MKKNLKGCVELIEAGESRVLVDMNQIDMIERTGLVPDLAHKKSAHATAKWHFEALSRAVFATGGSDLTAVRYLTFSVFAIAGIGGSFSLMFDSSAAGEGRNGYEMTLPITRDGWNSYRLELPFMRAVGEPTGWDKIESICFDCVAGGQANHANTKLYIDNLFVWEDMAPPLYASMPELKGAAVFSRTGNFSIVDRKRISNTPDGSIAKPFERNGILWLPMATVAAGIAHSAVVDTVAETLSFTYRRKKYFFVANERKMTVNGVSEPLTFAPISVGGCLFFPCDFVRNFFRWRQTFTDPMGLIVLSNRKSIFESRRDEGVIWQLIADTTFLRPDGERVLADLHRNFPNPARGRLLASFDELMQLRKNAKVDAQLGDYVERLKSVYGLRSERFAKPSVAADADVAMMTEASEAILAFAMLYRVTGDKQYAERVAVECEAIAAIENWGNASEIAQISFGVTVGYDWCRHIWSEGRKALIERGLLRAAMRPCLAAYDGKGRMWRLGGAEAAEINCAMLALSLAMADVYPQTSYKLLDRVLRNIEPCFESLAPDGGHPESVSAWEKSCRALVLTVAMLRRACGSDYGFGSAPGFAATAYFPIHAETSNGSWNYHDATAHAVDTSLLFRMSQEMGDPVPAWMRRQQILSGKKQVHPFDILFYTPVDDSMAPYLPLDAVYRKAGLAMMRSGWSAEANFVGLHGGRNHERRGDLDAGSVVLEMGGVRFFEETGGEENLPMLLRRRAAGQNTFAVEPAAEPAPDQNPDAIARLVEMRSAPERAYAVVDMASTSDLILRGKRGAMLTDGRSVAVIQDEVTLEREAEVVWHFWTKAEVKLNASGRVATLKKDGKTLACRISGIGSPVRFEAKSIEDSGMTCLEVRANGKEKLRVAFVCRLLAEGESAASRVYEVVPMSRWSEL
ncbi:MAG: hypothetical protein IJZ80_00925 [Clostridia bacterium]|nr:hypothetical protein [Clostridia bacterium]